MLSMVAGYWNVLVALVLPIAALVYFLVRRRKLVMPFLAGVLTFLVFQVFTRLPLLQVVLPNSTAYLLFRTNHTVAYILLLCLSAGVFEECGRYIVMRLLMKNNHTLADGIAFGIGHGGTEAVLIVGVNALYRVLYQPFVLQAISPLSVALPGIERLLTMVGHVGLSVLVLQGVRRKKPLYLLVAVALHTALNAAAVLILQYTGNALLSELVVFGFAVAAVVYMLIVAKKEREGFCNEKTV